MKKVLILFLLLMLCGCRSKEVKSYSDDQIDQFDEIIIKAKQGKSKRYDLRCESECRLGRIPSFFCVRTVNSEGIEKSLDQISDDLNLILNDDYNYLIVLIDEDGSDAQYLAEKLFNLGYYNIHYFENGYNRYVSLKGDSFIPETGDCKSC